MTQEQISTLINLLAPLVVFLASFLCHRIYSTLTPDYQQIVSRIANMVVPAIEQSYTLLSGEQKRVEAVKNIQTILEGIGIKNVPDKLIDVAIDAAVYQLNQQRMTAQTQKLPIV